jgi:hypothetical protein
MQLAFFNKETTQNLPNLRFLEKKNIAARRCEGGDHTRPIYRPVLLLLLE